MPYNILLVDDDREFREEFRDYLEDYQVIEAGNGEEALELLKKPNVIDLVILDVMMPGLRGTEVLKEMRKIDPDLGIIILTGYSSESVAIEALKGQANDYIQKPVEIDKAKEIIERILETKKEVDIDTVNIEGKIERVKRFVQRNYHKKVCLKDAAQAVYLSPKYLSRVFKQSTGKSFSEYKSKIKMEKAKELLSETGYNVNQLAEKLGYENAESFIRIFKKLAGYTPTEYRKKIQRKKILLKKKKAKGRKRK
jgi:two-component system response regulator YesN